MFEITVLQRDSLGNVIYNADGVPKVKRVAANNGNDIWEFWNRNGTHLRKKKKQPRKDHSSEEDIQDP